MKDITQILKEKKANRSIYIPIPPAKPTPAKEVLSEADVANKAATKRYNDDLDQLYESELAAARAKYQRNKAPVPTAKPDDSPIQAHYITAEGYYVGYTSQHGVLLISEKWPTEMMRLQNKKQPYMRADNDNDKFNNLSEAEFKTILDKKPKWAVLQKAYNMSCVTTWDNPIKRMKLADAKIIL